MSPQRATSADEVPPQSAEQVAALVRAYLDEHAECVVSEGGKVVFDLRTDRWAVQCEGGSCLLQLWSGEGNVVRRLVAARPRGGALRLAASRPGSKTARVMEIAPAAERRTVGVREQARRTYVRVLERVIERKFAGWSAEGFRTAMDLERSFGPAYARGWITAEKQAWAVVGVNAGESQAVIDGALTAGILWLDHCRTHGDGRRIVQGLKLVVPRGAAMLTRSRMAWLNEAMAKWELWEFDEKTEALEECELDDTGNIEMRLVQRPDETLGRERFHAAIAQVMALVDARERQRVETQLRSPTEMLFRVHGLEFARAWVSVAGNSFAHKMEITVGVGAEATPLTEETEPMLRGMVAELMERRSAGSTARRGGYGAYGARRIGEPRVQAAHAKVPQRARVRGGQDALYRAAPERWMEQVLRANLAPLTAGVAPEPRLRRDAVRALPRLDAEHVYAQVGAIAGASDRGLLDLLGVTADGRLAVIELKAEEDMHFALQGLDYWVRVRQHHREPRDAATGLGAFQRAGYFRGVELSPLPPRLVLIAPALRVHPATETVLRHLSPQVEWQLLAIDERWREQVRVVWRKSGGKRSE